MADWDSFKRGGVAFPLTSSTANELLQDADPAVYHALRLVAASLRIHIAARLAAEAEAVGLVIADAVAQTLHVEPSPFLLIPQFKFPILAIYRQNEAESDATLTYARDTSEWEFAYVLPSLQPRQVERLQPILRAASRVIAHAVSQGYEPGFNNGEKVWQTAGIESARMVRASYGGFEPIQETPHYFRAVVGTLEVREREMPYGAQFQAFTGADATVREMASDGTTVEVTALSTQPALTVTNVVPSTGSKAGGATLTITGTNFPFGTPGKPVRVFVGSAEATDVVILSATQLQCTAPAHAAYPTFIADVVVQAHDGRRARLPAAFTFTTP